MKGTLYQRLEIINSKNDDVKIRVWVKFGFSENEAQMMVKGRTCSQAICEQGGVWQVGNIPYPQAISAEHAQKLHVWNFGDVADNENIHLTKTFG